MTVESESKSSTRQVALPRSHLVNALRTRILHKDVMALKKVNISIAYRRIWNFPALSLT